MSSIAVCASMHFYRIRRGVIARLNTERAECSKSAVFRWVADMPAVLALKGKGM